LRVTWLKRIAVLAVLALWLPATNHCKLEQIPGLAFLACCELEDSPTHQDEDCETDGCATFENQLYKTETAQIVVASPTLLLTAILSPLSADLCPPVTASYVPPDAAPALLPRVWQFSYRTALPPRAPSLHS